MAIYMTIVFKTTGPAVEGLFDDDFSVKVGFFLKEDLLKVPEHGS